MLVTTEYGSGYLCGNELTAYIPVGTVVSRGESYFLTPVQCQEWIVPDGTDVIYHDRGWQARQGGGQMRWDECYRIVHSEAYGYRRKPCTLPKEGWTELTVYSEACA